jgi:hypothetical protein
LINSEKKPKTKYHQVMFQLVAWFGEEMVNHFFSPLPTFLLFFNFAHISSSNLPFLKSPPLLKVGNTCLQLWQALPQGGILTCATQAPLEPLRAASARKQAAKWNARTVAEKRHLAVSEKFNVYYCSTCTSPIVLWTSFLFFSSPLAF